MHFLFAVLVSLTLRWEAPVGGPTPDGYKLLVGSAPGDYDQEIDLGMTLSVTRLENLNTPKFFAIVAYNNFGDGPRSNEVSAGLPFAPAALSVTRAH